MITALYFIAAGWTYVGTPKFSAGTTSCESLFIDSNGNLYLAYQDGRNGPATVMKYTNTGSTGWTSVGNPGFSAELILNVVYETKATYPIISSTKTLL